MLLNKRHTPCCAFLLCPDAHKSMHTRTHTYTHRPGINSTVSRKLWPAIFPPPAACVHANELLCFPVHPPAQPSPPFSHLVVPKRRFNRPPPASPRPHPPQLSIKEPPPPACLAFHLLIHLPSPKGQRRPGFHPNGTLIWPSRGS